MGMGALQHIYSICDKIQLIGKQQNNLEFHS